MTFVLFALFTSMKTDIQAQSLVGLWSEPTYQMQLQLNADGTYQLQYSQGNSYGQYAMQGNQFWLQDVYGNALAYTVYQLTNTNFQISDANGTMMNFVNQNPTHSTYTSNSMGNVAVSWEQKKYNKALTTKDGETLKEKHVRIYANLLEFLIEANLKPHELNQLQQAVVVDFEANPTVLLKDAKQVADALKVIYAQNDFMTIGAARQELFANLHAFAQQNPALQQSPFFQILYQNLQVLAYDSANKLVLTDKDVEAYVKYVEFNNQLMGINQPISQQEKQTFVQQLASGFSQLTLQQKQTFCSARLLWQVVEANWNQMTPAQQQQIKAQMMAQVANPNTGTYQNQGGGNGYGTNYGGYNNSQTKDYSTMSGDEIMADINADLKRWADEKGMTVEEYLEYRRGFNATMPTLQRMNMESHATMMNLINAMGGSDDYWTVRDVDSAGNIIW